jgi:hypothetical protein
MRKKLFRLTMALALSVSFCGILTTQTAHAQCGCACSYVCPNTCNLYCDGCDLKGLIEVGSRCCREERDRTPCGVQP